MAATIWAFARRTHFYPAGMSADHDSPLIRRPIRSWLDRQNEAVSGRFACIVLTVVSAVFCALYVLNGFTVSNRLFGIGVLLVVGGGLVVMFAGYVARPARRFIQARRLAKRRSA